MRRTTLETCVATPQTSREAISAQLEKLPRLVRKWLRLTAVIAPAYLRLQMKQNSRLTAAVVLAALVTIPCVRVSAQTGTKTSVVIAGVTDAQSGAPLADAEVTLSDLNVSARTDWSGEAR